MTNSKRFWIGLSLLNLCLVALFGLLMRSKILFPLPFLDYRNLLSAHSHFAFGGWVGLALITFLIHDLLPPNLAISKPYQGVLWAIELCSVGMAVSFPVWGYNFLAIAFSTGYILATYYFCWIFFRDLRRERMHPRAVTLLAYGSVAALVLSSVGPFALSYILITKSGNSLLYRDAVYTFLHFQYNGFFTLGVFAVFLAQWKRRGLVLPAAANRFATFLVASVVPTIFLALLWHNLPVFYLLAAVGCLFIVLAVVSVLPLFRRAMRSDFFAHRAPRLMLMAAFVSFILKMLLTIGTIFPPLGKAVYGARPVIIGFLHLVFLAFVSFFILSSLLQEGFFSRGRRLVAAPVYVFAAGVVANELFLMIQGLEILFKNNSNIYSWLLWGAAILLLLGAVSMATTFYTLQRKGAGENELRLQNA